jgi:uncharacterized repeat protein (TIGR01451 family)
MKCISLIVACFVCFNSWACFPEGLYITSQADLDALAAELAGCTEIEGNVYISGDIPNVDALSSIQTVYGNLEIFASIPDLSGLANLSVVYGNVNLNLYVNLASPVDPNGLQGLVSIGGTLSALENNFAALPSVSHVGRMCIQLFDPFPDMFLFNFANQLESADYLMFFGNYLPAFSALQSVDTIYMRSYANGGVSTEMFPLLTHLDVMCFGTQNFNNISMPNISHIRKLTLADDITMPSMCGGMFQYGSHDAPVLPQITYIDELSTSVEIYNLDGLSELDSIGSLNLIDGQMASLSALSNVTSIESLRIVGCYSLIDLTGLASLEHLTQLMIANTSLQTLEGINPNLIVPASIVIEFNDFLSACGYLDYCGSANAGCNITVQYNGSSVGATTCDELADVMNTCTPYTSLEVITYLDVNCNNIFEWGVDEYIEVPFFTSSSGDVVSGNYDGYQVYLNLEPNTSYLLNPFNFPGLETSSFEFVSGDAFTTSYVNLGYCPATDFMDVRVSSLPHEFIRTDYEQVIVFNVKNMSASTADITAMLEFGIPDVHVVSTESVVYSMSGLGVSPQPGIAEWQLPNVGVGENVMIRVRVAFDNILPLGSTFDTQFSAHLSDAGATDFNPENNVYTTTYEVVGSYDPNIKEVDKSEVFVLDVNNAVEEELLYTIHFQNTGSAPAINVRVEDQLDFALSPSSIEVLCSSHDYYTEFDGHKVVFHFNNINLPDSNSNEPASHGFISFKINPSNALLIPMDLLNSASIYFDFNEPVITPPAITHFFTCPIEVSISEESGLLSCDIQDAISYQWYYNNELITGAVESEFTTLGGGNYFAVVQFNENCPSLQSNVLSVASLAELGRETSLVVFPNPISSHGTLRLLSTSVLNEVSIADAAGRLVVAFNPNSSDVALQLNLEAGIYIVSTSNHSGPLGHRVFVVK